jgi:single-strand DNA-binding protein
MNSISISGRVCYDASLESSKSGTPYTRARVASDVGFGERKKTLFIDCLLFGNRAEALVDYLVKGQSVVVVGELEPARTYDSNGETRISQSVMVRDLDLVGGSSGKVKLQTQEQSKPYDDEIPF